ncbi:MAG: hypothetical protein MR489_09170, partial [Prevotella sp.]|nr:hypothetical protein [Prevotella sp.]
ERGYVLPFYPFTFNTTSPLSMALSPSGRDGEGLRFTFLPFYLFTFKNSGGLACLRKWGNWIFHFSFFVFHLHPSPMQKKWRIVCFFGSFCVSLRDISVA